MHAEYLIHLYKYNIKFENKNEIKSDNNTLTIAFYIW